MSKQVPDLLASYFTLAGDIYPFGPTEISPIPFRDRVEAAAKAGWKGVGLIHADVKATAEKIGYSEMRNIVEGAGIKHLEIEFLGDWYKDGEARAASDKMRHELFQMAEELKIRDIKIAPGLGSDLYNPTKEEMTPDIPRMAEAFAGISREAAEHGTGIALEIMPFSNVRTLEVALAIVEQADQPNCGLLIDIWHMARGGISYDEVAKIPSRHVSSIELDDADQDVIGQLWEDTIYRRKLPGEGVLNPPAFIDAVRKIGYQGPWGVEILSETLRKLPVEEMAKRTYDATAAQFS
ncbi:MULTISPECIES: sugar phosphate isomerase/epimerase family protein [Rhizobium/Agrobacterium group]|nr:MULTISPECIES: sugar phosphate isomerase/epimerase family protein [Rhizobium/Agrobacterium group]NTD86797.1 sugar phosphate isomerase/epimerase [Agrobacterium tumefaciens]NTE11896.1 sugar phosphate isomerase/epimerase [Agrobacterium tumefaciens]NTE24793.1 sugar phosphate isomerase/epimerase [Agrobacterium tumefaciens]NTE29767.1 sugar phosphate isomerase/epimerase [Agrobacterium tumefaciens]NTE38350.1 sugar phosphate isomerase/epimerase [Agrobacterium tumefaciens]